MCQAHGGRAPQVRAAANRRLVEEGAARELAKAEVVPIGDPVVALADLASEIRAEVDIARRRFADGLAPDAAWSAFYERTVDRLARILEACGRLGLEERRVRLEEDKLDMLAAVMRRAWAELGHDQDDPRVQDALEVAYREIDGAA